MVYLRQEEPTGWRVGIILRKYEFHAEMAPKKRSSLYQFITA
jgi:hypothetical protein